MFFENAKDARQQAKIETTRTHKQHVAVPCRKYLCPPKTYFGQDSIPGYTIVLKIK